MRISREAHMARLMSDAPHMTIEDLDLQALVVSSLAGGESQRTAECTGIKGLMLAVLEEGIRTYLTGKGRLRIEANHWIISEDRRSLFSFTVVCEMLGLDSDAARTALKRMLAHGAVPHRAFGRSRPNVRRDRRFMTTPALLNNRSRPRSSHVSARRE